MKKEIKLNLVTLFLISAMNINIAEAQTEEILDQINVVEKNITNDKKPFTEAKAKSTREHIFKDTQTIDQVIRSIPGAFTQQDKGAGVVSVNIRGENGLGRVNTWSMASHKLFILPQWIQDNLVVALNLEQR